MIQPTLFTVDASDVREAAHRAIPNFYEAVARQEAPMAEMDFETASGRELLAWYGDHPSRAPEALAALRDRLVAQVEARVRDETVDREREAARKAWDAAASYFGVSLVATAARDRYLAREYPAPAPSSVTLSDGSVVELRVASTGRRYLARPGSMESIYDWRGLAITGADFEALKAFAATVEGR